MMTRPKRYLLPMGVIVLVTLCMTFLFIEPLVEFFSANAPLNGFILAVLIIGTVLIFRQVTTLNPSIYWLEKFLQQRPEDQEFSEEDDFESGEGYAPPRLIAPMAAMLAAHKDRMSLSALSTRSILDTIGSRLDESRQISGYFNGLPIFLGLLGTFWGLLETVGSVGDAISSLSVVGGDISLMFDELKTGLDRPLSGMGTAFSSSLFGLAGALLLGALNLFAGQAQNRFYSELEEWLSSVTKLSAGGSVGDGEGSVSAYVGALLEQSAEGIDKLQRTISRTEEKRSAGVGELNILAENIARQEDQIKSQQLLMQQLAEGQESLCNVMERMNEVIETGRETDRALSLDPASEAHLRNIDVHISRMLTENAETKEEMVAGLRSEIRLLARTIAAAMEKKQDGQG